MSCKSKSVPKWFVAVWACVGFSICVILWVPSLLWNSFSSGFFTSITRTSTFWLTLQNTKSPFSNLYVQLSLLVICTINKRKTTIVKLNRNDYLKLGDFLEFFLSWRSKCIPLLYGLFTPSDWDSNIKFPLIFAIAECEDQNTVSILGISRSQTQSHNVNEA